MLDHHCTELRVRYDECDPMGLVHHSNYLKYFEIARTELFRASGGNYRLIEESGLYVVVIRAECNYRRPARYDDRIVVRVQVEKVTAAKIIQNYTIERGPEQLVTGSVTLAVVDQSGTPQRIPESIYLPG